MGVIGALVSWLWMGFHLVLGSGFGVGVIEEGGRALEGESGPWRLLLVRPCVMAMMDRACVIPRSFVGIRRLAD
uniref:Secreted protein n=1 Tax=Fagus sylvatica TaxID=28930 RepID=A0A2N9EXD6_FAGSY